MRKLTFSLTISTLLLTAIFITCKKDGAKNSQDKEDTKNQEIITKVISWIDRQKSVIVPNTNTKLDSLKDNLDFEKLRIEQLNQKEQFIAIPIKKEFIIVNNKEKDPINTLLLVINDSGIIRGSIVQYIPQVRNKDNTVPINTFSKIFNNKTLDCSGQFAVLTITDEFHYQLSYKDGKIQSYGIIKKKVSPGNSGGRLQNCWDMFLVTIYTDGSETWDYLYSWCDDCNTTRLVKGGQLRVGCSGGGGENNPPDCCIPLDGNIQLSSTSIAETIGYDCGLEGTDPSTGRPIKTCTFSWYFSTNTLLTYTWKYMSIEQSNIEKDAGVWKFKTGSGDVTHQGMGISGTIPLCVSFSCNINSATPSVSSDRTQARMDLIFTTNFNISCCPWCQPSSNVSNAHDNWFAQ